MFAITGAGAIGQLWAYRLGANNACFITTRQHRVPCQRSEENPTDKARCSNNSNIHCDEPPPHDTVSIDLAGTHDQNALRIMLIDAHRSPIPSDITASFICTKSYDAHSTAISLDKRLPESTPIILFQNGLGSQMHISETLRSRPIFAASTTSGANLNGDGELIIAGEGVTVLGPMNDAAKRKCGKRLVEQLNVVLDSNRDSGNASGDEFEQQCAARVMFEADIETQLWRKLIINCGINAITALEKVRNGEITNTATYRELWSKLISELVSLAPKAALPKQKDDVERLIHDIANHTRDNVSSMLQDCRRGKPTEIDDINGFAAKTLLAMNQKADANLELVRRVHALRG